MCPLWTPPPRTSAIDGPAHGARLRGAIDPVSQADAAAIIAETTLTERPAGDPRLRTALVAPGGGQGAGDPGPLRDVADPVLPGAQRAAGPAQAQSYDPILVHRLPRVRTALARARRRLTATAARRRRRAQGCRLCDVAAVAAPVTLKRTGQDQGVRCPMRPAGRRARHDRPYASASASAIALLRVASACGRHRTSHPGDHRRGPRPHRGRAPRRPAPSPSPSPTRRRPIRRSSSPPTASAATPSARALTNLQSRALVTNICREPVLRRRQGPDHRRLRRQGDLRSGC